MARMFSQLLSASPAPKLNSFTLLETLASAAELIIKLIIAPLKKRVKKFFIVGAFLKNPELGSDKIMHELVIKNIFMTHILQKFSVKHKFMQCFRHFMQRHSVLYVDPIPRQGIVSQDQPEKFFEK